MTRWIAVLALAGCLLAGCATTPPPLGPGQAGLTGGGNPWKGGLVVVVGPAGATRVGEFQHRMVLHAGPQRVAMRPPEADSNGALIALISSAMGNRYVAEISFTAKPGHEYVAERVKEEDPHSVHYQIIDQTTGKTVGEGTPERSAR